MAAVGRTGPRTSGRLILATVPVTVALGGFAFGPVGSWLAGIGGALLALGGVGYALRPALPSVPGASRVGSVLAVTLLGITAGGIAASGDDTSIVTAGVLLLALPEVAWIALLWRGPLDLGKRLLTGALGVLAGILSATATLFAVGGLAMIVSSRLTPDSWHGVAGALLGFAVLEAGQATVLLCVIGPGLTGRPAAQPPVFAVAGYEIATVTAVADGHVLGRLDDGREIRTAVGGAQAPVGSRWLVRIVGPEAEGETPAWPVRQLR